MTARPRTLRGQVTLLAVAGLAVAAGFVAWEASQTRQLLRQRALAEAALLAAQMAQAVRDGLDASQELVLTFAEGPASHEGEHEACSAFADRLLRASTRYANIGAADSTGEVYCSGADFRPPLTLANEPWFQRAMRERRPLIGKFQIGQFTGRRIIRVTVPIRDLEGRVTGVAFATLDLVALTSHVATAALPSRTTLTVLDGDGTILLRDPNPERWIGVAFRDAPLWRAFQAQRTGQVEGVDLEGETRLVAFTSFPVPGDSAGFTVAIGFHPEDVYLPLESRARRTAALSTLALGLLVLGFWYGSRRLMVTPIESLARAADRLASGDSAPADVHDLPAEIGQVATALDRAGRRILAGQAQFAGIIDSAMDAIVTVDAEHRIVLFNPAAERIFGYSRDQVLGQPLELLLPDGARDRHRAHLEAFAAAGAGRGSRSMGPEAEPRGRRADGSEFPIEASISLLATGEGRFFTAILRDVTDRRRADATVLARAAELEAVLRASPLAVVWVSADLTVTGWFGAATAMFGWSREEVLGKPLPIIPPGYEAEYARLRSRVFAGNPFTGYETVRQRKDGTLLSVSISTAPIRDPADVVTGLVATYEDISTRRASEAERERLLAEAAHAAVELRALHGQLVLVREEERARIARELHDQLGSALTALKFDASWLDRHWSAAPPEKLGERVRGMLDLLDDTIGLGRRLASELRPPALDLGLAAALETSLDEFTRRTGLAARLEAPANLPALEPRLALALFRIAQEALTNVARHADARQVTLTLAQPPGELVMTIGDDGRGLPAAARESALGVVGMRERAALVGGRWDLRARPGGGTLVEVRVPLETGA